MSLRSDAFPSSAAFDTISQSLSSSPASRTAALKSGNAVFAFVLTNAAGATESWYIDLKKTGTVGKGEPPEKAAVTMLLSEADFGKLVEGKANAQRLFMGGKLKVKGDVMRAAKVEPILKAARGGAKL